MAVPPGGSQSPEIWRDNVAERRAATITALDPIDLQDLVHEDQLDVSDIPQKFLSPLELEITQSLTPSALVNALRKRRYSAVQVTAAFIKRASIAHRLTNCLTEVFFTQALAMAQRLDEVLENTGLVVGSLHGLPISLKDQIEVEGTEHNLCYAGFVGRKAAHTAVLAEILVKQGAVLYCRTNMSQGLWFAEGYNNVYGRTLNPFNRALTSGGSSGGEGALIAMRGSLLGVGSDLGGSVRIPAGFSGIYGLRPSYCRIPYCLTSNSCEGQETIRSVLGPMSISIDGLKLFMKAILDASPWNYDPWTPRMPWSEEMYSLKEHGGSRTKLCFAIMWDNGLVKPVPPYFRALSEVKDALLAAGHEVIDWKPFKMGESERLNVAVTNADGGQDLLRHLAMTGEARLNDILNRNAVNITAHDLWQVCAERSRYIKEHLDHWMSTVEETHTGRPVDAIIAPAAASAPMPHDGRLLGNYTNWCNVMDYTASTLPVTYVVPHLDPVALPHDFRTENDRLCYERYEPERFKGGRIGVQVVGRKLEEEAVIRMTEIVDAALCSLRNHT